MVMQMIVAIHGVLNLIKGFSAGYSGDSDKMMIEYQNKRYIVTFEEVCNVDDEDAFVTMRKYLR